MSKASPTLGALIESVQCSSSKVLVPTKLPYTIAKIEQDATSKGLGRPSWLAIVTATTMTRGSPESIMAVSQYIISILPPKEVMESIEFMRKVGMSALVMNGVPRTVKMLTALRASLPRHIITSLNKTSSRHMTQHNIATTQARGQKLWDQIHRPFSRKVEQKFGEAHPDLPSVVIGTMYGTVLVADTRITTSIGSIACLQAQPGYGPQVFGHICGLKNAWKDGSWKSEPNMGSEESIRWLLSDSGCKWILEKVDELVEAIDYDERSSAIQVRSKL